MCQLSDSYVSRFRHTCVTLLTLEYYDADTRVSRTNNAPLEKVYHLKHVKPIVQTLAFATSLLSSSSPRSCRRNIPYRHQDHPSATSDDVAILLYSYAITFFLIKFTIRILALLKSLFKERPAIHRINAVRTMIDGHCAVLRDNLPFHSLLS